jgi:hypothetical protein
MSCRASHVGELPARIANPDFLQALAMRADRRDLHPPGRAFCPVAHQERGRCWRCEDDSL